MFGPFDVYHLESIYNGPNSLYRQSQFAHPQLVLAPHLEKWKPKSSNWAKGDRTKPKVPRRRAREKAAKTRASTDENQQARKQEKYKERANPIAFAVHRNANKNNPPKILGPTETSALMGVEPRELRRPPFTRSTNHPHKTKVGSQQ